MSALRLLPAAALAALAACNPFAADETSELPCPYVRVLGAGEQYVTYRAGAEPVRDNLELVARFVSIEASCLYRDDDAPRDGMVLELALTIGAERGPAAPNLAEARVPYFVALIGPARDIVSRQEFVAAIPFPDDNAQFLLAEPEEISLTFPAGGQRAPWEFEVMISFQLSQEQLDRAAGGPPP